MTHWYDICFSVKEKTLFPFLHHVWYRDFQARWQKLLRKKKKWIVFRESRYVNSNPERCQGSLPNFASNIN